MEDGGRASEKGNGSGKEKRVFKDRDGGRGPSTVELSRFSLHTQAANAVCLDKIRNATRKEIRNEMENEKRNELRNEMTNEMPTKWKRDEKRDEEDRINNQRRLL
jgi:hypothetical protein